MLKLKTTTFNSSLTPEQLSFKLRTIFNASNKSFSGKLSDTNHFEAHDKWTIIGWNVPYLKRKAAYLKGEISESEQGSRVKISAQSNSVISYFGFFSIIVGFVIFALSFFSDEQLNLLVFSIVFMVIGILCFPASLLFKKRLLNNFKQQL